MRVRVHVAVTMAAAALMFAGAAADAKRPNVVLFLADDQPYNGMSCTGNTVPETPNMDRLAADGVLFENALVTTPIRCVSRASLCTGQE